MTLLRSAALFTFLVFGFAPTVSAQRLAPVGIVAQPTLTFAPLTSGPTSSTEGSAARALVGGVLGGAIGAVALGFAAALINSSGPECSRNPDACSGGLVESLLTGGMVGHAIGIPVGAHLANGRRGKVATSLAVSGAVLLVELIAVNALVDERDLIRSKPTLLGVLVVSPIVQLVSSVMIESRNR
ncbi:MAG: hypothetical protein H0W42_00135 [Gemmatimonadaceae bacterium]|nr:hypothetical protein [Gemmatimonadaceae bacterium]